MQNLIKSCGEEVWSSREITRTVLNSSVVFNIIGVMAGRGLILADGDDRAVGDRTMVAEEMLERKEWKGAGRENKTAGAFLLAQQKSVLRKRTTDRARQKMHAATLFKPFL